MIPVDRASNDPFYRYKMPEVVAVQETSKTVIQNIDQIAKALCRSPNHILKFLSMTFGCTCTFSPRYALNGAFDADRIQAEVYSFIDMFVLCKECRNPETKFVYGNVLGRSCNSCGAVFDQDSHKLNLVISKDRGVNEDRKYEASNKSSIHVLMKEDSDNAERIYEVFKQESMQLEQVFEEYVKSRELKQLRRILREFSAGTVLQGVENMLEANKKDSKIDEYIYSLVELGFAKEEIVEYISKPRAGKKRSPIVKKIFDSIWEEFEE